MCQYKYPFSRQFKYYIYVVNIICASKYCDTFKINIGNRLFKPLETFRKKTVEETTKNTILAKPFKETLRRLLRNHFFWKSGWLIVT